MQEKMVLHFEEIAKNDGSNHSKKPKNDVQMQKVLYKGRNFSQIWTQEKIHQKNMLFHFEGVNSKHAKYKIEHWKHAF